MRLKVAGPELSGKLSIVKGVAGSARILQVLTHVLLDAEAGYIIATDLERFLKVPLKADIVEPGRICLPASQFSSFVHGVKEEVEIAAAGAGRGSRLYAWSVGASSYGLYPRA